MTLLKILGSIFMTISAVLWMVDVFRPDEMSRGDRKVAAFTSASWCALCVLWIWT